MRTVGVEEELLLVDPTSGEPLSVAGARADRAERAQTPGALRGGPSRGRGAGGTLEGELHQQQLEIDTRPHTDLGELSRGAGRVATSGRRRRSRRRRPGRGAGDLAAAGDASHDTQGPVPADGRAVRSDPGRAADLRVPRPRLGGVGGGGRRRAGQDPRVASGPHRPQRELAVLAGPGHPVRELSVTGVGTLAVSRPDRGAGLGAALPGDGVRPARDGRPAG